MSSFWRRLPIIMFLTITVLAVCTTKVSGKPAGIETQAITEYFRQEVAKTYVPGAVLLITNATDNQLVVTTGNYPSAHAPQIMGSTTKSFTALAIMQLVESGKVALDEPAITYLPNYKELQDVTVRELLRHTSGFGTTQTLATMQITSSRGSFTYANLNYTLLGEIIEQASGQDYANYLQQHILDPLGMKHTFLDLTQTKTAGLVPGHRNWFGFNRAEELPYPGHSGAESLAAGYLISSAEDLGRYARMYLNGGEGIISQTSIDEMWHGNQNYGFGWFVGEAYGQPKITHSGMAENYISSITFLPNQQLSIVILVPAQDYLVASPMFEQVEDGIVAQLLGHQPSELPKHKYILAHLSITAICALLLTIAAATLIRLPRWKRRLATPSRTKHFSDYVLHLGLPISLAALPAVTGSTWSLVRLFAPDLFWVIMSTGVMLIISGGAKLKIAWDQHRSLKQY